MSNLERGSALLALLALLLFGAVPARGQAKQPAGWAGGGGGAGTGADPPPSICDAIPGNLVQNCGFETGDFTNWTVVANNTPVCNAMTFGPAYGPNSGIYSACLGNVGTQGPLLGTVSQTITDIPGETYTLTFWLQSDGRLPNEFKVSYIPSFGPSTVLTDMVDMGLFPYRQFSFPGLIGTGSDTIKFEERDDPLYLNLDDVSFVGLGGSYALSYYSNANIGGAPHGTLQLVNDGNVSDIGPAGDLCASIYVFDNNENMEECCSCRITPNGFLQLTVDASLTSNPANSLILHRGVIKVVSSAPSLGGCDPTTANVHRGIRGWLTHIEKLIPGPPAFEQSTEDLKDSTLGVSEAGDLAEDCSVILSTGGGKGVCSCH
jgi:hypothetical protein